MYNATYLRNLVDQLENQIVSSIRASYTVAKAHGYSGSFSQFYEEVRPQRKTEDKSKIKRYAITPKAMAVNIKEMRETAQVGIAAATRIHELRSTPDLFKFLPQEEAIANFLAAANLNEAATIKLRADIEKFLGPVVNGRLIVIYPDSVGDILDFNSDSNFRVEINIGIKVKDVIDSEYPDRCETPMAENFQQSGQYGKPPAQFSADWKDSDRRPIIKTILEWESMTGIGSRTKPSGLALDTPFDITKLHLVTGKIVPNENDAKISDQVRADMENMTMLIPVDKDGNPTALSPEYGAVMEKWLVPNTTPK